MRSLRDLTDQIVGVRLHAATVELWSLVATVQEHIRIALNDALMEFPILVEEVFQSGTMIGNALVMPRPVNRILRVEVAGDTITNPRTLLHWEYRPTAHTNIVRVHDGVSTGATMVVTYQYQQPSLPPYVYLVSDSLTSVVCTGAHLPSTWPAPPAYIELYHTTTGTFVTREIAMYQALVAPTSFSGLVRGIEGHQQYHPVGATVSACWNVPDDTRLRAVMLLTTAGMYEAFIRHRTDYNQFTAIASMQAMTLEEMQVLVRDYESRARVSYGMRGGTGLPAPSQGRLRKAIPR